MRLSLIQEDYIELMQHGEDGRSLLLGIALVTTLNHARCGWHCIPPAFAASTEAHFGVTVQLLCERE